MTKHSKHYDETDRNTDTTNSGKWHSMRGYVSPNEENINPKMLIPKEDLVKGHIHCSNPTIDQVLESRKSTYGDFATQAEMAQKMKNTLHASDKWVTLSDMQRETVEMILHKISIIVNGDPNYKDSWTDIIGYAKLVEKTL